MASRKRRRLPSGWERRRDTYSDKTYYIDHNTQTTHWTPPPPSHTLPPSPSPSPSLLTHRTHTKRAYVRHRRSSTLDDIYSHPIPAPPPSLFRNPSKSVTVATYKQTPTIKRARTKTKPTPPPIHHRKRAPTNRRIKSHKPRAPPPSYNTIQNMPPPPPPRSLPNTPNHSTPMPPKHSHTNAAPSDRTRLHPLQRSNSFDIPPPPPMPSPPPPPRLEED
eukprot:218790_1